MGVPRTLGLLAVGTNPPVPVFTGPVTAAVSFSILSGIATIVLGAGNLPANGYNGPAGFPTQNATTGSKFDIYGGVSGQNNTGGANSGGNAAGGQQITLWNFTTATYFNGRTITVLDNNPANGSFRFYFNHANVANTADAGNTAPIPFQAYRVVRLECAAGNTGIIYVGDFQVSSTRYFAALALTGQFSIEVASENIRADRLWITGSVAADAVAVSTIY